VERFADAETGAGFTRTCAPEASQALVKLSEILS
jgi:hypothetical protein